MPFGIAQIGKSFRNEITPRNFTFRSREFEQMEMEFFCHPAESRAVVQVLARPPLSQWYLNARHRQREPAVSASTRKEELSHYSVGTADIEYAFPFLANGEFGELEGIAHRGDFDLRIAHGRQARAKAERTRGRARPPTASRNTRAAART